MKPFDQYIADCPVSDIHSDANFNGRALFAPATVADLADDIRTRTLLFPILLRPMEDIPTDKQVDGFKYSVLAGFRRFMAIGLLQWETVPCLVKHGLDEEVAKSINLAENLKRKDMSPIEVARGIRKHFPHHSISAISKLIKQDVNWVSRRLRLLDLPNEVIDALDSGRLVLEKALLVAQGETREEQLHIFKEVTKPNRSPSKPIQFGDKIRRHRRYRSRGETNTLLAHIMENGDAYDLPSATIKMVGKVLLWSTHKIETDDLLDYFGLPPLGDDCE